MTYAPPPLPAFLADTHSLKPIVGVPTDGEMVAIHATIRAMNGVSHIPALYDLNLSIRLAQHLFDAQMAVYRSKYSFSVILGDITYTPPALPSYITVTLEPIVGAPSDQQLESVYSAVRALGGLAAHVPSMFDPKLNVKLSQHLFDIQLARHIQYSAQGQFTPQSTQDPSEGGGVPTTHGAILVSESGTEAQGNDRHDAELAVPNEQRSDMIGESPSNQSRALDQESRRQESVDGIEAAKNSPEEQGCLMGEIRDTMKAMSRALLMIQNSTVWAHQNVNAPGVLVNMKGELPSEHGLPWLVRRGDREYWYYGSPHGGLTDQELASYLMLYGIGIDLIDVRENPTIKSDKKAEAEKLFFKYISTGSTLS